MFSTSLDLVCHIHNDKVPFLGASKSQCLRNKWGGFFDITKKRRQDDSISSTSFCDVTLWNHSSPQNKWRILPWLVVFEVWYSWMNFGPNLVRTCWKPLSFLRFFRWVPFFVGFSRKRLRRVLSRKASPLKIVIKVLLKWWLSLKIVIKHCPKFCWSDGCL